MIVQHCREYAPSAGVTVVFQQQKNTRAMQIAGGCLVLWLLLLYSASTAETGLLKWHAHMHWLDKLVWYVLVAIGPALAGFLIGVGLGGRKVLADCKECGGKYDVDTMLLVSTGPEQWRCQKCCERYDQWDEWRKTQDNPFNYRNGQERKWARMLWESDPGYLLEDELWQGPNGLGFPDKPVGKGGGNHQQRCERDRRHAKRCLPVKAFGPRALPATQKFAWPTSTGTSSGLLVQRDEVSKLPSEPGK